MIGHCHWGPTRLCKNQPVVTKDFPALQCESTTLNSSHFVHILAALHGTEAEWSPDIDDEARGLSKSLPKFECMHSFPETHRKSALCIVSTFVRQA